MGSNGSPVLLFQHAEMATKKIATKSVYSNPTLRVFHLCLKVKKLNGSKSHFMVPDAKRFNHLDFEAGRAWNMNRYGG